MVFLPNFLYFFVFPNLLFYSYHRCSSFPFKWYWSLFYTASFFVLPSFETFPDAVILSLNILLLVFYGVFFFKQKIIEAVSISSLIISIFYLTTGFSQSLIYWIGVQFSKQYFLLLKYIDTIGYTTSLLFYLITFFLVFQFFPLITKNLGNSVLFILSIPLFFISLVEQTISTSIYGNTVIWDKNNGFIFPIVKHFDIIFLHLLAYISMWSTILTFQKLIKFIQTEQQIQLLKIQTQTQEIYVKEAQIRYEQTRSFRHDIKNHFLVLKELLSKNQLTEALSYLSSLDHIASSLSNCIYTKNVILDALLGSKLDIAKQKGIRTECQINMSSLYQIKEIDWCIILANAIDNAIKANQSISMEKRYLYIYGKQKGNLFLLHFENNCKENASPVFGTGLSNILAIVEKYGGTMEIEVTNEIFKLDMLFVLSHQ